MNRIVIDQAANFSSVIYLSCSAKTAFGTDQQETTKDGVPRWTVEIVVTPHGGKSEVMRLTLDGREDPCAGWMPATAVHLKNLTWNFNPKKDMTWYAVESVVTAVPAGRKGGE